MRTIFKTLLAICSIVVFSSPILSQGTPASSGVQRSPEAVLTEFYKWYVHTLDQNVDPVKSRKTTLRKYVTTRFMQVIERNEKLPIGKGFDADWFLQSQEDEGLSSKKLSVSHVSIKGTSATAIVTFEDDYPRVTVTLTQEGGVWKIDRVKNSPLPQK